jgi:putative endonuclease
LSNARGAIYIGVTNDIKRRIAEHKSGKVAGFTSKYRINRLVYYEEFKYVADAIEAEKRLKGLLRRKKLELVRAVNPTFKDLSEELPMD